MTPALKELVDQIKASPMFYLFQSSRELFHSNFWQWLGTLNLSELVKLFSDKTVPENATLYREYNQSAKSKADGKEKAIVDLAIITLNEKAEPMVLIENKVKDFPRHEQLDRIKNTTRKTDNGVDLVLATLFYTPELLFNGWKVKTYKEIATSIKPNLFTENCYYRQLIADYKAFTLNLAEIAEKLPPTESYDFSIADAGGKDIEVFQQINLWEGYQKLRASHLLIQFEKVKPKNINVITKYGVFHKKATMDFFVPLNKAETSFIGIQIEGKQYRKVVITNNKKAEHFAQALKKNGFFFTEHGQIGVKDKNFLRYGETFRYEYQGFIGGETFQDLFLRINADLQYIQQNLSSIQQIMKMSEKRVEG